MKTEIKLVFRMLEGETLGDPETFNKYEDLIQWLAETMGMARVQGMECDLYVDDVKAEFELKQVSPHLYAGNNEKRHMGLKAPCVHCGQPYRHRIHRFQNESREVQ